MRPEFPPHVAAIVRRLAPDLKRSIKHAVRALSADPGLGQPLLRELEGLWRYRVRRFRIVYRVDRRRQVLQILAVGHRRAVYEEVAATLAERQRERTRSRSTRRR
jgi:mRNA interferase RelE/StbE